MSPISRAYLILLMWETQKEFDRLARAMWEFDPSHRFLVIPEEDYDLVQDMRAMRIMATAALAALRTRNVW